MLTSMDMMPGQLLLWPRWPFFCSLINTPLFHSSSTFSSFHIQLQKPTRTSSDTSPLALITSGVYCHSMVLFHSHTVSFFVAFLISELVYGAMSTHHLCSASVVCTYLSIHVFHFILNILAWQVTKHGLQIFIKVIHCLICWVIMTVTHLLGAGRLSELCMYSCRSGINNSK